MKKLLFFSVSVLMSAAIMSCYAVQGELLSIFSEDFSGFTAGLEGEPDLSEVSTLSETVPAELTHGLQWRGRGLHQAGGACAVMSYDDRTYGESQGWIQTPYVDVRLDEGNFILRFRVRSFDAEEDSIIMYLYDKYSSNYYASVKRTITKDWQVIEVPFQHNSFGNRLACVQIGAYNHAWMIDDVEFIQDVYAINAPHAIAPKDVSYEQFTARWDSVWSASSYLVSAFYYADENKEQRVYVCEAETADSEYVVTGTEKGKTYYFTVKAKNAQYVSEESNEVQVYVPIREMAVPTLSEPSDIGENGYTAHWLPVERAMGYAVRHFLKHTASVDEEYTLVHEDLETITNGDFEYPGYFYDYNLDKYSKIPGWQVNMGCTVAGMIGIDNYFRRFEEGKITSPEFDLSRDEGRYQVMLNVYAVNAGDTVYVDSYGKGEKQHREYLMENVGADSFVVDFTNGSDSTYFTITFSGIDKMFIDDIYVKQLLKAGESIVSALESFELEGEDNTSYVFTGLDAADGDVYMYSVAAWSWSLDEEGVWGPTVYSEYSEPKSVRLSSGKDVANRPACRVYAYAGALYMELDSDARVSVYTADGKLLVCEDMSCGTQQLRLPSHAVYIVRVDSQSYKVVL